MIATLYKLPTWIMEENKPSYNLFIQLSQQAQQESINCETIEYPTLTTLNVRSSLTLDNWNIYNYININNLWYKIVDVSFISANNNVVNIDGEIDICTILGIITSALLTFSNLFPKRDWKISFYYTHLSVLTPI